MNETRIRQAQPADIQVMCELLLEHGPNPWNYLPEADVRAHLQAIASGETLAVLVEGGSGLLGFVSYRLTHDFSAHQPTGREAQQHAYICEAVVHRGCAGQGLGSRLLEATIERISALGVQDVYIDRHEENAASAGMMRKAGFTELLSYDDHARRSHGSRRSTLCCRRVGGNADQ